MPTRNVHSADNIAPNQIEIEFVDTGSKPIGGMEFKLKLPDGTTKDGTTEDDGLILLDNDTQGNIEIDIAPHSPSEEGAEEQEGTES
jgi:hypothetical protein